MSEKDKRFTMKELFYIKSLLEDNRYDKSGAVDKNKLFEKLELIIKEKVTRSDR